MNSQTIAAQSATLRFSFNPTAVSSKIARNTMTLDVIRVNVATTSLLTVPVKNMIMAAWSTTEEFVQNAYLTSSLKEESAQLMAAWNIRIISVLRVKKDMS